MKRYVLLFVVCSCHLLQSVVAATNLLSIYLVAKDAKEGTTLWRWPTNLASLRVISPPVLADADFVSFDWTNQTFVTTRQAAQRLAAGIWSREGRGPTLLRDGLYELIPFPTPFVMKACGESVYMGCFYSHVFNNGFGGPVILSHSYAISSSIANNITFDIELGYPFAWPGTADPRRDRRIVDAVQNLFPHEKR
jgi:hypothetical protein